MRVEEPKEKYFEQLVGLPDADLTRVRERMVGTGWEAMSISGAEARILQFLIRGFGVGKIAEFGTFLGYSALAMAKALPSDGLVVTVEKDPKSTLGRRKHSKPRQTARRWFLCAATRMI